MTGAGGCDRRRLLFGLLFGIAGFAVNTVKLELFFNVDFLFGSVFVFLAFLRFGAIPGIVSGVIAGSCTWFLWSHPWAVIIFSAEAVFVALRCRGKADAEEIVLSDILYWTLLGGPLVWAFYHGVMKIPAASTLLIVLKQSINGNINALLASLVNMAAQMWSRGRDGGPLPSVRHALFVTMMALVMFPAMSYIVIDIRGEIVKEQDRVASQTATAASVTQGMVNNWITGHHQEIETLAHLVGNPDRVSIPALQKQVETFKAASAHFKRMGVHNRESTTIAYAPQVDELGHSNLGLDFSDRPYIPILRQTLKPYVPDVVMGRVGKPSPIMSLIAPLVEDGEYKGYCIGVLELSHIARMLESIAGRQALTITLLDRKRQVIASTRPDLTAMAPFLRPQGGTVRPLPEGTSHWIPKAEKGTSIMQRWRRSFVVKEIDVDPGLPWKVVVESSMAPTLDELSRETTNGFAMLAVLALASALISRTLSRRFVEPLLRLQRSTRELPARLKEADTLDWPRSRVEEFQGLTDNFRQMAGALRENFRDLESSNETLEERVARRTADLTASEARFRSYIENAPDGIYIVDRSGRLIDVNPAACRNSGYAREALVGMTMLDAVATEDREAAAMGFGVLLAEKHWVGDLHVRRGDGTIAYLTFSCAAISDEAFIAFAKDITERKRIEGELLEAKQSAESASRTKSGFLANVSHEIRTPMNGILGMTRLLKRTGLNPMQQEYLDDIANCADNLMILINDILDLSKIEAGRMEVERVDFRLREIVSDVVRSQSADAAAKGLPISIEISPEVPDRLKGDPLRLKQVLVNLLGNALKFTRSGEIRLEIFRAAGDSMGALVQFSVSDTGIGISPEVTEKIFSPFVQADASTTRRFGGSGLGLAICRRLVDLMGGRIWVEGRPGGGSVFRFFLPFSTWEGALGEDPEVGTGPTAALRQGPLRILLAEDQEINIKFTRAILEGMGHAVEVARDGKAACDRWAGGGFDLILMDVQMPEMDGEAAMRFIRGQEAESGGRVPIIALTAHAMQGDRARLLASGFDGYISKPMDLSALAVELDRVRGEQR